MKIKVCGLRDPENIKAIADLPVDYLGLIFHPGSPRYVGPDRADELLPVLESAEGKQTVGVFVNAEISHILEFTGDYALDFAQLHGNESADYCRSLKQVWPSLQLIKAFQVGPDFDFAATADYERYVDLFLFDTAGAQPGGNGTQFDWDRLSEYKGFRQFLLSGGIGPADAARIKRLNFPQLAGIDVNSGFETEPGLKSVDSLRSFVEELRG